MRTSVYVGASLDGFIARNNGDIDWLVTFENNEVSESYRNFISKIDAIVMGRGTFEKVLTFPSWPYEKKVFVLSTSLTKVPDVVKEKATLLSMKPKELLKHLSNRGFKSLYIDGGQVIQSFLREDLIDELTVTRIPVLIGNGIPLFGHLENDLHFKHLRSEVLSNGLVESRYERKRH